MACLIAENQPLQLLRSALALPPRCHSRRPKCAKGRAADQQPLVMGIPGAALGYCQALLGRVGGPRAHTEAFLALLSEIEAPWSWSHELFWGHRQAEMPENFVSQGMSPLAGKGRVPILITGLDPARDLVLHEIADSRPAATAGDTVLVRMVIRDESSVRACKALMERLLESAGEAMPAWWPLLQGDLSVTQWRKVRTTLGPLWPYANIAINPFASPAVIEEVREQLTVAQVVLSHEEGVHEDGTIEIHSEMRITGAGPGASYILDDYAERLAALEVAPTLIVLGPSLPQWSREDDKARLRALLPLLHRTCRLLWRKASRSTPDYVLGLAS